MRSLYFLVAGFFCVSSYTAEYGGVRKPRPASLIVAMQTMQQPQSPRTVKRLSGTFSPCSQLKSGQTSASQGSICSSPDDAASFTYTVIPDLANRLQGMLVLLPKKIHALPISIKVIEESLQQCEDIRKELMRLKQERCKVDVGYLGLISTLHKNSSVALTPEELKRVDGLLKDYEEKLVPLMRRLQDYHTAANKLKAQSAALRRRADSK